MMVLNQYMKNMRFGIDYITDFRICKGERELIRVLICSSCLYDKSACHCNYGQFIEAELGLDFPARRKFVSQHPNGLGKVITK